MPIDVDKKIQNAEDRLRKLRAQKQLAEARERAKREKKRRPIENQVKVLLGVAALKMLNDPDEDDNLLGRLVGQLDERDRKRVSEGLIELMGDDGPTPLTRGDVEQLKAQLALDEEIRAKVALSLSDPRPNVPHKQVIAEAKAALRGDAAPSMTVADVLAIREEAINSGAGPTKGA